VNSDYLAIMQNCHKRLQKKFKYRFETGEIDKLSKCEQMLVRMELTEEECSA